MRSSCPGCGSLLQPCVAPSALRCSALNAGSGRIRPADIWARQATSRRPSTASFASSAEGSSVSVGEPSARAPAPQSSLLAGARALPPGPRPPSATAPSDTHANQCQHSTDANPGPQPNYQSRPLHALPPPSPPPHSRSPPGHTGPRSPPAAPPVSAPARNPLGARELTSALSAAAHPDQLLSLLHEHELLLGPPHLDAALSRLARLLDGTAGGSGSGGWGRGGGGRGRGASVARGVVAGARVGKSDGDTGDDGSDGGGGIRAGGGASALAPVVALYHLLRRLLPGMLPRLRPRDCASMLAALGRLQHPQRQRPGRDSFQCAPSGTRAWSPSPRPPPPCPPPPPAPAEVTELLVRRLLGQLAASSVRDRAQLLHSAVKLRLALPEGAVAAVLRSLDGQLAAEGKPQDVSMVLWSLASLGAAPHPAWLQRLTEQALSPGRLAGYSAQALANTAWALARMGARPHPEEADGGWLGALVDASDPLLTACYTQELCNLLWALAVLRHRPPARWLVAVLRILHDRTASLTAQDVSNVVWSLAALHVRPGLPLLQRLVARALAVRRGMSPQGTITTLWGLARLRVQLPERAVGLMLRGGLGAAVLAPRAAAAAGAAAAGRAGSKQASGSGGGSRGTSDGRGNGSSQGGGGGGSAAAAAARPGDLAGAALVLARCRHVPPEGRWLMRFYSAVARELPRFGPRELCTLLYGLAVLGPLGLRPDPHWLDRLLARAERLAEAQQQHHPHQQQQQLRGAFEHPRATQQRPGLQGPQSLLGMPPQPATLVFNSRGEGMDAGAGAPALPQRAWQGQQAADPGVAPTAWEWNSNNDSTSSNSSTSSEIGSTSNIRSNDATGSGGVVPGRLDPEQMAIVLWAVARLAHVPSEAWVTAMARAVAGRAKAFKPQEAATALRALHQLAAAAELAAAHRADTAARTTRQRSYSSDRHEQGGGGGSSSSSSTGGLSAREVVTGLAARLAMADQLPRHSLYGTLRAASLASAPPLRGRGGGRARSSDGSRTMSYASYATVADQLLVEAYSVSSLGLLQR